MERASGIKDLEQRPRAADGGPLACFEEEQSRPAEVLESGLLEVSGVAVRSG